MHTIHTTSAEQQANSLSSLSQMSASRLPAALAATEEDISLLLAAQAHIG